MRAVDMQRRLDADPNLREAVERITQRERERKRRRSRMVAKAAMRRML